MYSRILFLTMTTLLLVGKCLGQQVSIVEPSIADTSNVPSCVNSDNKDVSLCAETEATVLASVVRLVLHGDFELGQPFNFRGSTSHATVMKDRYLVTHNHFESIDMLSLSVDNSQGVVGFSLYNAAGSALVRNAPVGTFWVVYVAPETLVLDFGPNYFVPLDVSSASFLSTGTHSLVPGMEVAQVDWDAERAYVIWTTVIASGGSATSPYLEVDNYVMIGASGGGVFWNGHHIGNNCADITITNAHSGDFVNAYCRVALNTPPLLAVR